MIPTVEPFTERRRIVLPAEGKIKVNASVDFLCGANPHSLHCADHRGRLHKCASRRLEEVNPHRFEMSFSLLLEYKAIAVNQFLCSRQVTHRAERICFNADRMDNVVNSPRGMITESAPVVGISCGKRICPFKPGNHR